MVTSRTILTHTFIAGTFLVAATASAECDNGAPMGDWKYGRESRDEAEAYETMELSETIEKYIECLEKTVPVESSYSSGGAASSDSGSSGNNGQGGAMGAGESTTTSAFTEMEGGNVQESRAVETSASGRSNNSSSPPAKPVNTEGIASDGSYAKALREAHRIETDSKIKAALAVEYKKLTGKDIY